MRDPIFDADPAYDAMSLDELRAKTASGDRARALGALSRRSATDASLEAEVLAALRDPINRTTKIMNVPIAHIGMACLWLANERSRAAISELVSTMAEQERRDALEFLAKNDIALDIPAPPQLVTRYSEGTPDAPLGPGRWTVELRSDDTIRVIHEKQGTRVEWRARALPPLAATISTRLTAANFPAKPSVREAPAGTRSFSIMAPAPDDDLGLVSGFISPEYAPVRDLFADVVGQVTGDRVFGATLPIETPYVTDASEVSPGTSGTSGDVR